MNHYAYMEELSKMRHRHTVLQRYFSSATRIKRQQKMQTKLLTLATLALCTPALADTP